VEKANETMTPQPRQIDEISQTLARIKTDALALVCALMGGVGMFVATAWLVIKDGPQAGEHLKLLSNYFVGYSVTWWGSIVALFYGALIGWVVGWAVGTIYNKVVNFRQS
jgi:uncharacterized membrane protein